MRSGLLLVGSLVFGSLGMGPAPTCAAEPPVAGAPAPDFNLPDQAGKQHRLADYRGRYLVLYFYPKDDTPGCTAQACSFRDDIARLHTAGAQVVGVSVDGVQSHADFARKHKLPFALLADTDGVVAATYGSLRSFGPLRIARRNTFLIAPDGKVAAAFLDVDPKRNVEQVLAALPGRTGPAR